MPDTKKVYLAGPITGLDFAGSTDWRNYAKQKLAGGEWYCRRDTDGDGDCPSCVSRHPHLDLRPTCQRQTPETGIVGYSPMRAKDYLAEVGVLSGHPSAYDDYILSSSKGIMYRDHWDCQTADLILVNFMGADKISVGTVMEIAFGFAYRKPVVIAMEEENIHHHAMLDVAAGWICPSLDYAIDVTKAILLPDGVKVAA